MNHSIEAHAQVEFAEPGTAVPLVREDDHFPVALALGLYVILLNIFLICLLITLWPATASPNPGVPVTVLLLGRWPVTLTREAAYLWMVVLAGGLGSYVHLATSFADFVGNRVLKPSWAWWYILRPFIGMALALIVYFVERAGLMGGVDGTQSLSPYGVAAIAGMCGLFCRQATDKLREVFDTIFRTRREPDRADPLPTKDTPGVNKGA